MMTLFEAVFCLYRDLIYKTLYSENNNNNNKITKMSGQNFILKSDHGCSYKVSSSHQKQLLLCTVCPHFLQVYTQKCL